MIYYLAIVKNEEDIIEENIKHHLKISDSMIITDNNSSDKTKQIISNYNIMIIEELDDEFNQNIWMDRMIKLAFNKDAHAIIPSDVDEFWMGDIKREIDEAKLDINCDAIRVPLYNYLPSKNGFKKTKTIPGSGYEYETQMDNYYNKINPGKIILLKNREILNGNHSCIGLFGHSPKIIPAKYTYINHFPLRNFNQFKKKVINGANAVRCYHKDNAYHWRYWNKKFEEGKLEEEYFKIINESEYGQELEIKLGE